jgi:uncharacterized membrane protein
MTTETTLPVTTSDERVMAALAHLFGLLAALIVYVVNKDKSRFVRFQSLQALALDALWIVLSLGLTMCLTIGIFLGTAVGFAAAVNDPQWSESVAPILFGATMPWLMFACIMPFSLVYWLLRLVACISVATGRDFRYPLIGRQVEAFLKNG